MHLYDGSTILSDRSNENHRLIPIHQDPVFNVPAHSAREYDFFEIAALLNEVLDRIAMRNAHHILLDDGAIIEYFGHVMAGGANQFHSAREGLVIWLRAHECR